MQQATFKSKKINGCLLLLSILLFSVQQVRSQEIEQEKVKEKKFDTQIEGQISLTTNGKAAFLSMGGVSLKLIFKKFNVGITMGPALKFEEENAELTVVPVLGVGPQIYFLKNKRLMLSFFAYYIGSRRIWTQTAGIGYVLTKPK